MSAAIFRGTVLSTQSYVDPADGQIYTRTVLRVDEVFKGTLPPLVKLVHRGGTVGDRGEMDGFAPQFKVGEERLLLVSRRADGTLYATRGSASALRLPTGIECHHRRREPGVCCGASAAPGSAQPDCQRRDFRQ